MVCWSKCPRVDIDINVNKGTRVIASLSLACVFSTLFIEG